MGRVKDAMVTDEFVTCPECEGEGYNYYERPVKRFSASDIGELEEYRADCDNCDGSGEVLALIDDEWGDH